MSEGAAGTLRRRGARNLSVAVTHGQIADRSREASRLRTKTPRRIPAGDPRPGDRPPGENPAETTHIVFFADEAGSWQVGVDWREVLPAWFKCLRQTAEPEEYARSVVGIVRYDRERYLQKARVDGAHRGSESPGYGRCRGGRSAQRSRGRAAGTRSDSALPRPQPRRARGASRTDGAGRSRGGPTGDRDPDRRVRVAAHGRASDRRTLKLVCRFRLVAYAVSRHPGKPRLSVQFVRLREIFCA